MDLLKSPPDRSSSHDAVNKPATTAPSPWKKPKLVSFGRNRLLKRRSDVLNFTSFDDSSQSSQTDVSALLEKNDEMPTNDLTNDNDENLFGGKPPKTRKLMFNRFTVTNNSSFSKPEVCEHYTSGKFF